MKEQPSTTPANPVADLQEAVMMIERTTYDLAEKTREETISSLILIAADLQRVVDKLLVQTKHSSAH